MVNIYERTMIMIMPKSHDNCPTQDLVQEIASVKQRVN